MDDQELALSFSSPSTLIPTSIPRPHVASVHGPDRCYPTSNVILYHYNHTGRMNNRQPQEDKMNALKMVIIASSCLIILENLLVLLAIVRKMRARRWVYSCLASITFSDLLTGIAYLVNLCLSGSRTFQLTPTLWFLREGVLFVALAASTFSLLVTAVERYSAMVRPIAENAASKTVRLRSLIIFCWTLAVLIGLLPLLGWNCLCHMSGCSTLLPLYAKSYILFAVIIFCVVLVGVVGLYASIYCWVQRSTTQVVSSNGRKRSLRLLKTVVVILLAFLVCWIPLFILLLIDYAWANETWQLHKVFGWILTLAVINSFINPVIYSLGSKEVRKAVTDLLCCCCVRAGWRSSVTTDVPTNSSTATENSLKMRESFRGRLPHVRRGRELLSSNSSMMSAVVSDDA
ncbi:sphingosine 1-phosphate receptor 4 [Anolis carolinensis]|uniref:Sphingosine-1-phosphate receptor 4 n=1 Tax=Anolis carolinensis TaxID=28377 RepID=H9GPB8_ANOCA|nr:PREDICTED: sphingosine 1-phosphate receptor 4 [Anolis carolinensis]|eukprot:XP_003228812.1 PREDICTED: sphingosine 1-phosphate receptor 4 [Anolis carolinensis]